MVAELILKDAKMRTPKTKPVDFFVLHLPSEHGAAVSCAVLVAATAGGRRTLGPPVWLDPCASCQEQGKIWGWHLEKNYIFFWGKSGNTKVGNDKMVHLHVKHVSFGCWNACVISPFLKKS